MARTVAERGDVIPALGELFREYGFEGASLKIISERTGLGKGIVVARETFHQQGPDAFIQGLVN